MAHEELILDKLFRALCQFTY